MTNIIPLILLFILCTCTEREANETINLNFEIESMEEIDVSKLSNVLSLRNDSLVIGAFVKFWTKGDHVILVASNGIFRFDGVSGKLINMVSSNGHAKNEYTSLWRVMPDDELLFIYDQDGKKLLKFGMDGTFYNSCTTRMDNGFQFFVRLNDSLFVGMCDYTGISGPELALYDDSLNYKMTVGNLVLNSGMFAGVPLLRGEEEVLYMPLFSNKVYCIDHRAQCKLKYSFDFGKYNLDNQRFKNDYHVLSHINESYKTGKRYALPFYLLVDNNDYMIISFTYNMEKCIGLYNKLEKTTKCFRFVGNEGDILLEYTIENNELNILFENEDSLKIYRYKI